MKTALGEIRSTIVGELRSALTVADRLREVSAELTELRLGHERPAPPSPRGEARESASGTSAEAAPASLPVPEDLGRIHGFPQELRKRLLELV